VLADDVIVAHGAQIYGHNPTLPSPRLGGQEFRIVPTRPLGHANPGATSLVSMSDRVALAPRQRPLGARMLVFLLIIILVIALGGGIFISKFLFLVLLLLLLLLLFRGRL